MRLILTGLTAVAAASLLPATLHGQRYVKRSQRAARDDW